MVETAGHAELRKILRHRGTHSKVSGTLPGAPTPGESDSCVAGATPWGTVWSGGSESVPADAAVGWLCDPGRVS